MNNIISNSLSRKAMKEAKMFIDNLMLIEGQAVEFEKAMNCIKHICEKYTLSTFLDTKNNQILVLQNGKAVGLMPLQGDSFNSINSIGILYGEAA